MRNETRKARSSAVVGSNAQIVIVVISCKIEPITKEVDNVFQTKPAEVMSEALLSAVGNFGAGSSCGELSLNPDSDSCGSFYELGDLLLRSLHGGSYYFNPCQVPLILANSHRNSVPGRCLKLQHSAAPHMRVQHDAPTLESTYLYRATTNRQTETLFSMDSVR